MRKRQLLFGEGGRKIFCSPCSYLSARYQFYLCSNSAPFLFFHQKGNRLFALFFSQARLVAFLLFLIALIAKLSLKKIATVVFTTQLFPWLQTFSELLGIFELYLRQNICLCRVDSLRSADQQLNQFLGLRINIKRSLKSETCCMLIYVKDKLYISISNSLSVDKTWVTFTAIGTTVTA